MASISACSASLRQQPLHDAVHALQVAVARLRVAAAVQLVEEELDRDAVARVGAQVGVAAQQALRLPVLQLGEPRARGRVVREHVAQRRVALEQAAERAGVVAPAALVADLDAEDLHGLSAARGGTTRAGRAPGAATR